LFLLTTDAKFLNFYNLLPPNPNSRASMRRALRTILQIMRPYPSERNDTPNPPPTNNRSTKGEPAFLLPRSVIPSHYDLKIHTLHHHEEPLMTFEGRVKIKVKAQRNTRDITLHSKGLHISQVTMMTSQNYPVPVKSWTFQPENDFLILALETDLKEGRKYVISLMFRGNAASNERGFFRASEGVFTTQFGPTHARKVFPCFDEPNLKAKFKITVNCQDRYVAISNMETEVGYPKAFRASDGTNMKNFRFKESVEMPTYIVAMAVTTDLYQESKTNRNVTVRVWYPPRSGSTPGYTRALRYILRITTKLIGVFENLLDFEYPLSKLDILPVPLSLDSMNLGMENWGLITVNEDYLRDFHSGNVKESEFCHTMSHEVVHNWFGNLVTPKTWEDLWLSEGIASYFHVIGCEGEDQADEIQDGVSRLDAEKAKWRGNLELEASKNPLRPSIRKTEDILGQFKVDQYLKGAAITNMIQAVVGKASFMKGIKRYLKEFAFKSVTTKDFVKSMDPSLDKFVDQWTKQIGFPVLTVKQRDSTVVVTQKPFFKESGDSTWEIPFTITTKSEMEEAEKHLETHWSLPNQAETVRQLRGSATDWVLADPEVDGFYVINYDEVNWGRLIRQLAIDHNLIPPHARLRLITDAWLLSEGGFLSPSILLRLLRYMGLEQYQKVWQKAQGIFKGLMHKLDKAPFGHRLGYMMRKIVDDKLEMIKEAQIGLTQTEREFACVAKHRICYSETKWLAEVDAYLAVEFSREHTYG